MIRTKLRYHAPASIPTAVTLLAEHRRSCAVLGGGTLLIPMMSRGECSYEHLVDPLHLGLDRITATDEELVVGARATYTTVATSDVVAKYAPLLAAVSAEITGGAQVRNQATVGGSACRANPASDIPAVLVALDARMNIAGPVGNRQLAAADFFTAPFTSAINADELLMSMAIPIRKAVYGYYKLKHCESSWPIATAVATIGEDEKTFITIGGVSSTPIKLAVQSADSVDAQVGEAVTEPWSDELAPGAYRQNVAAAVARRALAAIARRGD